MDPSDDDVVVEERRGNETVEPTAARHDEIEEAEVVADVAAAASTAGPALSFPRLHARTQRFTLGEPRTVEVTATGERILFLRSRHGQDPINCLWIIDASTGEERLLADPAALIADESSDLPPDELARRERTREAAGGITSYAVDRAGTLAAFALAGRLFVCEIESGECRELPVGGPVFDPRPDPAGERVAYVSERKLHIAELDGSWRAIAGGDDEPETVTWGSAEFIAAEEMRRQRGFWWSPDGSTIAATRVDSEPISAAWIGDLAQPATPPRRVAYPFAGTDNADVSLHLIGLDGEVVDVEWDRIGYPYLTEVHWSAAGLIISTQSRSQQAVEILDVDVDSGETEVRFADFDERWVELVPGTPRLWTDGQLVGCADRDGARRLLVDGDAVTPTDLQVRSVVAADRGGIVFVANPIDDASVSHVWRYDDDLAALTDEPGVHSASAAGGTVVIRTTTLDEPRAFWDTLDGVELASMAATPNLALNASLHHFGARRLATTVLLPNDHDGSPLPVLLDPYGGPHALRSVRSHVPHLVSQWFADHGFAVVVVDGRGTPGRGSEWERAVHGDLATAPLEDQIDALEQAAAELGCLDLERVAIRGWSFGGYLAALAVLLRPDRIHAAIAGAPVTEWRLYDTHYTERYLGDPAAQPDVYDGSSLLSLAAELSRPLLLIHGLADDNVFAAHTLQFSSTLLTAGRPHEVLPLVGVTHMTPQEVVAENLLVHQLDFLRRALAL
jgi:dipeptidyl-peptidase 4